MKTEMNEITAKCNTFTTSTGVVFYFVVFNSEKPINQPMVVISFCANYYRHLYICLLNLLVMCSLFLVTTHLFQEYFFSRFFSHR